jgi:putative MATE family efflux protein
MASVRVLRERRSAHAESVPLILSPKPLSHIVWGLAWPAVTVNLIQTVNMFVDRSFVSSLGTGALAGHGTATSVLFLMFGVAMALAQAATAFVSRFHGAQDEEQTQRSLSECLSLAMVLAVVSLVLGFLLMHPLVNSLLDAKSAGARLAAISFLGVALLGIPATYLSNVMAGALRGVGDTKTPMYVMTIMVFIHMSVSWIFIFGHFGAPRLGIAGAGVGLAASQWSSVLMYVPLMAHRNLGRMRFLRLPTKEWVLRILRIATPTMIQTMSRSIGFLIYIAFLDRTLEGANAVAALNIGTVAESIAFMPAFGYAMAASALIGQSLGAGVPERGERATWIAAWQACLILTVMGAAMFFFAHVFTSMFPVQDKAVTGLVVRYLQIAAVCEPAFAYSMVMTMALNGAGDVIRSAWIVIASMWFVRLPLAFVWGLHYGGGASAVFWSMTIAVFTGAIQSVWVFRSGKWKTARV